MSTRRKGKAAGRAKGGAGRGRAASRGGRSGGWRGLPFPVKVWLRRAVIALLVVFVIAPLSLVVLYRFVPVPVTPLMLIRLVEGQGLSKDWVAWEAIAVPMRQAVVAAEDNLFCEHSGFDWKSLEAAVEAYAAGERAGGGSTISMQTAKNLFLWPSRSIIRKGLEVPLTASLELLWPKQRILEVYLNIAEWGPGVYGVEAAARHYFDRPASVLSLALASRLAAVLPNPLEWSPQPAGDYVAQRAGTIRTRVRQLGPLLDCVSD
ncbi:MAG: monofunctional biosynthetic peptidoglycan transglycosylase [Kiloniellaceae bacterium]